MMTKHEAWQLQCDGCGRSVMDRDANDKFQTDREAITLASFMEWEKLPTTLGIRDVCPSCQAVVMNLYGAGEFCDTTILTVEVAVVDKIPDVFKSPAELAVEQGTDQES